MSDRVEDQGGSAPPKSTLILASALSIADSAGVRVPYESLRRQLDRSKPSLREARKAAASIQQGSRRRVTPIRKSFVRRDDGTVPPMAQIYQGGRSGTVGLKVYLALIWRCSAPPFSTVMTARGLAVLLDLDDPEGNGARRVAAALRRLAELNLIEITPRPGSPNMVTLLDESGDGSPYRPPYTPYNQAPKGTAGDATRERHRYFKLSNQLWLDGDIQELEGPGLVLLLTLLAERAGYGREVWWATNRYQAQYQISPRTRADGARQLRARYLLTVERRQLSRSGSVFEQRRIRNVYRLLGPALHGKSDDDEPEGAHLH